MKLKTFLIVGCLGGLFTLSSCTAPTNVKDYSAYVNPFIGTGGHGHTFPGAVVPHGMIQPSPDTRIDGWDACSGYYYADSTINGFSHTHVSGTGCCDYGDVLLMPTVGKQQYRTTDPQSQRLAYASSFSHKNEIAEPGYYSEYQKLSDEEIGTKLLLCGPKANLIGAGYEVEVEDGFVIEGK